MVYGIVQQSGGCITVDSRPGAGSTFYVHFPRAANGEIAPVERRAESVGERTGGTILLVEDEDSLRRLVRGILENKSHTVLEAGHGPEALEVAARFEGTIDLMLTDVVMPGMSGPELAGRLVAARPDVRVVYMSGYTDDAIGQRGVLDEGVTLIEKPFTPAALTELIARELGREK
jgi:two-component system cell cycle sensor histidine kinase/response regulator CckA